MRTVCIYKDNEDYTRSVDEWLEVFRRQTGIRLETMNPDENVEFCELYGVVEYPTIIALGAMGTVQGMWPGKMLPLIDEVAFYALQD